MRKQLLLGLIVVGLMGIVACGGGKYSDLKSTMEESCTVMDDYSAAMDKVNSVDSAVAVLNEYAEKMKVVGAKMKDMGEKYPELKNPQAATAEELKPIMEKFAASSMKLLGVTVKIAQYASDPKFQEAQKKFNEAMASFKQ